MRTFNEGQKEFRRATTGEILFFIREESRRGPTAGLGDLESLTAFDLRQEMTYLIFLDARPVGFASVKFGATSQDRRLTKLYVTPEARRYGCASYVMRGLKITQTTIPVTNIQFISLCRKLGFHYNPTQTYPKSIAELTRPYFEVSNVPAAKL